MKTQILKFQKRYHNAVLASEGFELTGTYYYYYYYYY